MEYKVGDKVRIKGCCHGPPHMFKKAMVGEIMKWHRTGCWIIRVEGEGAQIVNEDDFEAFPVAGNISPKGKEDAYIYIKGGHAFLRFWEPDSSQELTGKIEDAYKHNLMSEEDFKAKHQPKLKFKEWEVIVNDETIQIGCETFHKKTARRFMEGCGQLDKHGIGPSDFYSFIRDNKVRLGL